MAKTKLRPITPAVAAAMAAMLLSLAGCAGTEKSAEGGEAARGGTDKNFTGTETGEAPASISADEYAAMGMTAFATAGELEKAAGFGILSLDGAAAFSGYAAEEIVLDGSKARIRYAAGAGAADGDAESGSTRRVIIMESAPEGELDLTGRESLADVVVGNKLVSVAEDKAQSLQQAWWTADGYAYTVDTFNMEYADFKTLLETLCE